MYTNLSDTQRRILNYDQGTVVVKACPGSGKTFSVAARISRLIRDPKLQKRGLAIISFTNIACEEILEKLSRDFATPVPLKHPNFLGTIDSFINNYIFLPFGHLIMNCPSRPELVGEPHAPWTLKRFDTDYDQYFDKTTFDANENLIPIAPYQAFHFIWKYYNNNGDVNGNISNIIKAKRKLFKAGYANQSDANFIALKVLEKYPSIIKSIAKKFQYFIIDECQDTTEVQMKIIDLLHLNGASNIMLVGDRDQSIFEWNDARPELFDLKYNAWDKITVNENRRSSQNICDFIKSLSSFSEIISLNDDIKTFEEKPEIIGYRLPKKATKKDSEVISFEQSQENFRFILDSFLKKCEENQIKINKQSVAVIYRGNAISKYLGLNTDVHDYKTIPWLRNEYHVKAIIKGKHLYENGEMNKGFRLLEKGYHEATLKPINPDFYCTNDFINKKIETLGIKKYRNEIFNFVRSLPNTKGKSLNVWISETNTALQNKGIAISLNIITQYGNILVDDYFGEDLNSINMHPFYFGTVHSVKGKTFEAVLLLMGKKSGSKNYENIINADPTTLERKYLEEMRIIYVGITRPRKILYMTVPDSDVTLWKTKMNVS